MRRTLPLLGWAIVLAAALWLLHLAGARSLGAPPVDPRAWGRWVETVGADVAIVAVLRAAAIGLCWYLALATVAGSLVHRAGAPDTVAMVDPVLPRFLRRLLGATATGLTATAAGLTATVGPLLAPGALGPVSPAGADAQSDQTPAGGDPADTATATLRPGGAPRASEESAGSPTATLAPFVFTLAPLDAILPAGPPPARPRSDTWLTEPGDHLWSIAAETIADELADDPTEDQITRYWLAVVEVNRDRLVDPANPDLILPGQEFVLPPVGSGH